MQPFADRSFNARERGLRARLREVVEKCGPWTDGDEPWIAKKGRMLWA
jgi:hypothetical protein